MQTTNQKNNLSVNHSTTTQSPFSSSTSSSSSSSSSPSYLNAISHLNNDNPNTFEISVGQKMISACSGSVLTSLVVTPFDVVRVRLQKQEAVCSGNLNKKKNSGQQRSSSSSSKTLLKAESKNGLAKKNIKNLQTIVRESISLPNSNPAFMKLSLESGVTRPVPVSTLSSISLVAPNYSNYHTVPSGSMSISTLCKNLNVSIHPSMLRHHQLHPQSPLECCIASSSFCANPNPPAQHVFKGTFESLCKIQASEGMSALYRGLGITLLMSFPSNIVYLVGYEHLRDTIPIQNTVLMPVCAGALARTISATVVSPLELLKTRLQAVSCSSSAQASQIVLKGAAEMVKAHGLRSLWGGLVITLWRDVPFSAIYWSVVEAVKKTIQTSSSSTHFFPSSSSSSLFPSLEYAQNSHQHKILENLIAGSVGGSVAAICTSPFDVAKTRRQVGLDLASGLEKGQQVNSNNNHHTHHHYYKKNMFSSIKSIAQNEGISALFVGAVPRILKIAPTCAIMITTYEIGKMVCKDFNHPSQSLLS